MKSNYFYLDFSWTHFYYEPNFEVFWGNASLKTGKQDKRSKRVILGNSSNSSNFQLQSLFGRDLVLLVGFTNVTQSFRLHYGNCWRCSEKQLIDINKKGQRAIFSVQFVFDMALTDHLLEKVKLLNKVGIFVGVLTLVKNFRAYETTSNIGYDGILVISLCPTSIPATE